MTTSPSLTDLLSLPAGRELDTAVCELVCGGKPDRPNRWDPPYSTDIAAAWQVLLSLSPFCYQLLYEPEDGEPPFCVYITTSEAGRQCGVGDTLPYAICRAALRAKLSEARNAD